MEIEKAVVKKYNFCHCCKAREVGTFVSIPIVEIAGCPIKSLLFCEDCIELMNKAVNQ